MPSLAPRRTATTRTCARSQLRPPPRDARAALRRRAKYARQGVRVFGPKALAGIGALPDTVADRSLPIRLKRRAPSGESSAFARATLSQRRKSSALGGRVRRRASRGACGSSAGASRRARRPAQDACEPLVAIADRAGGCWPDRARTAFVALRARSRKQTGLVRHPAAGRHRQVFGTGVAAAAHGALLEALAAIEESPGATSMAVAGSALAGSPVCSAYGSGRATCVSTTKRSRLSARGLRRCLPPLPLPSAQGRLCRHEPRHGRHPSRSARYGGSDCRDIAPSVADRKRQFSGSTKPMSRMSRQARVPVSLPISEPPRIRFG